MGLTRLAIARPIAILMLIGGVIAMGFISYTRLKVDRFPALSFPFVSVSIAYPGASAADVEELVVKPVEDAVAGAPNVQTISSTSSDGSGSVNIQLAEGTDSNVAAVDIERRVAGIRGQLPADINPPSVRKADPSAFPIINLSVAGKRSLADLYDIANDQILPKLQAVPGVADVQLNGGLDREIQIKADPQKLASYGISVSSISQALQRENISSPGGSSKDNGTQTNIRMVGLFRTADQVRQLIVSQGATGTVTLGQVADVGEAIKDRTRIQRFTQRDAQGRVSGGESIGFSITKQSDANAVQVADAVKAALGRMRGQVPQDITFTVSNDTTRFTRSSLDAVQFDLGLAVSITALVLLLFLHSWRSTLIVLVAIPTSIITTFLFMFIMGFTLDVISLLALALMIGILVDDSIVVLENIDRHLRLGEGPREAALNGRNEIGLAAMAITLVDVVVFVPLAFMPGNLGQLFREFGFIIAAATLMSLFVSFTLTPMLASRGLKAVTMGEHARGLGARVEQAWNGFYDRLGRGYRWLLSGALRVRWLVLLLGVLVFTYSLAMVGVFGNTLGPIPLRVVGSEYAPTDDDNLISLSVQMPPGTTLDSTAQATTRLETLLMQRYPEIDSLFTSIGGGGGFGGGTRNANITVQLKDKRDRVRDGQRSVFDLLSAIRRDMSRAVPGLTVRGSVQNAFAGGGGSPITIRLTGDDLDQLAAISKQIEAVVAKVPGVVDVQNSFQVDEPELQVLPDRARMADRGVSAQQLATAVRAAFDGTVVSTLRPGNSPRRDIRLFISGRNKPDPAVIGAIPVAAVNGQIVRVADVAQVTPDKAPVQISRVDRQRLVTLSTSVQGRPLGDVANEVRQAVNRQAQVPNGYRVSYAGQVSQLDSALAALAQVLALSVILIYMLLAALYESWLQPLAIMFALPVALVGAFTGLAVTGNTLNIFSVIGIILLMGLVAKNGILLVDFANTLQHRGLTLREAVLESGRTRLRPILMTSITIVCAMTPLALKLENGAESRAPLAVAIVGGVISSLLLTLFLVPSVYTILTGDLAAAARALGGPFQRRREPQLAVAAAAGIAPAPPPSGATGQPGDDD